MDEVSTVSDDSTRYSGPDSAPYRATMIHPSAVSQVGAAQVILRYSFAQ